MSTFINDLIKLSNALDLATFTKEADEVDKLIVEAADVLEISEEDIEKLLSKTPEEYEAGQFEEHRSIIGPESNIDLMTDEELKKMMDEDYVPGTPEQHRIYDKEMREMTHDPKYEEFLKREYPEMFPEKKYWNVFFGEELTGNGVTMPATSEDMAIEKALEYMNAHGQEVSRTDVSSVVDLGTKEPSEWLKLENMTDDDTDALTTVMAYVKEEPELIKKLLALLGA